MNYLNKLDLLLVSVLLLVSASCNKAREADPLGCNLNTAAAVFEEDSISVTYNLAAGGNATLSLFYYFDESGKVEVSNPEFPQTITVQLSSQKTMQAGARGTVKNGFIAVSYEAVSDSTVYSGSDRCEQSTR